MSKQTKEELIQALAMISEEARPILEERLKQAQHKQNLHHQRMEEFKAEVQKITALLEVMPDEQTQVL